jgi:hypothetical protein
MTPVSGTRTVVVGESGETILRNEMALVGLLNATAFLLPNLNDTFGYACADTEQIAVGEGEIMARWWMRHGWQGLVAIAAMKRGKQPIPPVAEDTAYQAAVADLASDERVACTGEDEAETWRWWFDLEDAS